MEARLWDFLFYIQFIWITLKNAGKRRTFENYTSTRSSK
jgi:hypothetical protein